MLATANVELVAASSYCLLMMVVSRYSENELAATGSYYLLLAVVLLKHLKWTQTSIKTITKLSNI